MSASTTTLSLEAAMELAHSHHVAGRLQAAERIYNGILQAAPGHPFALHHLGLMALQLERYDVAAQRFGEHLRQRPDNVPSSVGMGNALVHLGDLDGAERFARQALRIDPSHADAHSCMGRIHLARLQHARATASFARAVELEPRNPRYMTALLTCMGQDEACDAQQLARMHRQFGKRFGAGLRAEAPPHANVRDAHRRLRVGFVSGDLRDHAVAYFIEPLWREIDRRQVELFAYSSAPREDATSQRLRVLVDTWRSVAGIDDAQLAQQVRDDIVDILIDLSGHTDHNRLLAFARKPAPLQCSWIGYPETTGLLAMDYYLADPYSTPPGAIDDLYVEKIVRLPTGAAFEHDPLSPPVNPLPALQRGHLTFGSFNRLSKLGDSVVAAWSAILGALPSSRLLLANVTDATQEGTLRQRFAAHGIEGDRLRFAPRMALADYLALHHEVDVLLDTFPYTGGTTTQHALWMGVPTITLAGLRRSERIGTAILTRVGLADWCVGSTQEYVARAVAAAQDIEGLAALRAGLRERVATSPLRQSGVVAHGLELALRIMWTRWCEGLPPEAFEVTLEQALQAGTT
jgi:predicted O-linked N-acetylglucosamine transferase (SPINDLY family)